jgi:hypothetical protein
VRKYPPRKSAHERNDEQVISADLSTQHCLSTLQIQRGRFTKMAPAETHLADSFEASVRYDQLVEEVERISNRAKFLTLEVLGETIARGLLDRFR